MRRAKHQRADGPKIALQRSITRRRTQAKQLVGCQLSLCAGLMSQRSTWQDCINIIPANPSIPEKIQKKDNEVVIMRRMVCKRIMH